MQLPKEVLKNIIVGSGFVPEQDFDEAVKSAAELQKDVLDLLVFRGLINEETISKLISDYFKVPFVNIKKVNIPQDVLDLIPEKMAKVYKIVPFEKDGKTLKIAMENPEDLEALEFAKRHTGMTIVPHFATRDALNSALGQYKKSIKEDFQAIISENAKKTPSGANSQDLAKAAEELPIVRILDTIVSYAIAERASDVHIETLADELVIRFRIDGMLRDIVKLQRGVENALVARIKILSDLKIDEHRVPQDGRYKFSVNDELVSLRVSIIPSFYGENVVMRILRESARPLSLEELGLTGRNLEVVRTNIAKPHGMILVTGPTGSGKTTTLYSVLNILNTIEVKTCTIEDPIEYGINRVTQIQVNPKTGLDFASGLRALLRHDPDIIMVGEIRDQETAEIAIHAALTGHLVLSTLHTNTAAGAIPRFIDMGVESFLLASTINVVIGQRLVRKICTGCISKYTLPESLSKKISKDLGVDLSSQKFYKGKGCQQCNFKGYSGRLGIYEVLEVTESIREIITKNPTSDEIQKAAVKEGMVIMLQDALDKVSAGLTTIEEVLRVAREN
jgi:type IV pilus assembly protein PilB